MQNTRILENKRSKRSIDQIITLIFAALYPIAPGYFKIAGLDSGVALALGYAFVYLICKVLEGESFRVSKRILRLIVTALLLIMIPLVTSVDVPRIIRTAIEYGVIPIYLYDYADDQNKIRELFDCLILVAAVMSIIGTIEFFTKTSIFTALYNSGNRTDLAPDLQVRGNFVRSETTFGHAISYAIYLSFCGLIALQRVLTTPKRLYCIEYLLILLNLILTVSRAPILIFFVVQLVLLGLNGRTQLIKYCGRVAAVIAIVIAALKIVAQQFFEQLQSIFDIVLAVFSESAAKRVGDVSNANPFEYRLGLLKVIPPIIKNKLLLGNGSFYQIHFSLFGHTYSSVDNAYLTWLVHYGLIGLIGYLIPIIVVFCAGVRMRKYSNGKILICIAIVYIANLFSVAAMYEYKAFIIIYSLALCESLSFIKNNKRLINEKVTGNRRPWCANS